MPTALLIFGWRLYFYANENKEPIHIHAEKRNLECKYWLLAYEMDIKEEYKKVRKVLLIYREFENFLPMYKCDVTVSIYEH